MTDQPTPVEALREAHWLTARALGYIDYEQDTEWVKRAVAFIEAEARPQPQADLLRAAGRWIDSQAGIRMTVEALRTAALPSCPVCGLPPRNAQHAADTQQRWKVLTPSPFEAEARSQPQPDLLLGCYDGRPHVCSRCGVNIPAGQALAAPAADGLRQVQVREQSAVGAPHAEPYKQPAVDGLDEWEWYGDSPVHMHPDGRRWVHPEKDCPLLHEPSREPGEER